MPLKKDLVQLALRIAPRLLTQACRDCTSPFYGCFDRNWWHYKIRDFPSIILQQGGYAAHLLGKLEEWRHHRPALDALAAASAQFWQQRALRHHSFEEYYPWEQGYPPLAFSALAVAKLALTGAAPLDSIAQGLRIAARQLCRRFESKAANQQVAGLAALSAIRRLEPSLVPAGQFDSLAAKTLALQHPEGWFFEYDGPDLGYLSVTIDCLWDLYDLTGDESFLASARLALSFIQTFAHFGPNAAGMHNARNTDYIVPYGIMRFATTSGDPSAAVASWISLQLFTDATSEAHPLAATDDRYITHYIGHSVIRAALLLQQHEIAVPEHPALPAEVFFKDSGHLIFKSGSGSHVAIISGTKGGIVSKRQLPAVSSAQNSEGEKHDFGWIVVRGRKQFVTHWWSHDWIVSKTEAGLLVEGPLFPHSEQVSSPLSHLILRCASFLFGSRLIGLLKRLLIFKKSPGDLRFRRQIAFATDGTITIHDQLAGLRPTDRILKAPRASKRHVASADSFQAQDLLFGGQPENNPESENAEMTFITRL